MSKSKTKTSNKKKIIRLLIQTADRFFIYYTEPLGTVLPEGEKHNATSLIVNLAYVFEDFDEVLTWLRWYGKDSTADKLEIQYKEIIDCAAHIDAMYATHIDMKDKSIDEQSFEKSFRSRLAMPLMDEKLRRVVEIMEQEIEDSAAGPPPAQRVIEAKQEEKVIKKPSQPQITAWESYKWVIQNRSDLFELIQKKNEADKSKSKPRWYSKEMYNCVKENAPFYDNHPTNPTPIPSCDAWTRYLRHYSYWLSSLGENKPEDNDQPLTAVRRQDVQNKDLSKISVCFDPDNPT